MKILFEAETLYLVIIGLLTVHLFFFLGFQYQLLNLLEEIAYPSDDPIMTSTLITEEPKEEPKEEPEQTVEDWDEADEATPEEAVIETQIGWTTVNQLRRMKKEELIGLCDSMGLDSDGTKTALVDRIAQNQ